MMDYEKNNVERYNPCELEEAFPFAVLSRLILHLIHSKAEV